MSAPAESARDPGAWPLWRVLAIVVTAYAAGASLAFLGFGAPSIVVLFLPAGVTLSALVLSPRRRWPPILLAVAVTEVAVDLANGMSPRWVWGFALANTVEPLIGALLLRRFVPGPVDLLRRRDLLVFLGCCAGVAPVVGALIGTATIAMGLGLPWSASFVSFWGGDATGVLVVGGAVLARATAGRTGPAARRWAAAVGAAAAATVIGFWPLDAPLFYLPLPVLFWLAFTQPLAVTLAAGMTTTVVANLMTATGHGPWAVLDTSGQWRTLTLQLFLATTIAGAWILSVGVAERDRARRDTSVEREARLRLHARHERELGAAHQLQRALLPVVAGDLPGVRAAADYRPADLAHLVGGDWYDVFTLPGGRVGFAVGDVVGHHVTAAAAMARLQIALRIVARTAGDPGAALGELDRAGADIADSLMTTIGFADYDPATGLLRYACAGHLPPLLVDAGGARYLWAGRSMPLGAGETTRPYGECAVTGPATLVWYTDGLVERRDGHIGEAMERLADAAARHGGGDPADLCRHLMRQMTGDEALSDDTALLCVRFTPVATRHG